MMFTRDKNENKAEKQHVKQSFVQIDLMLSGQKHNETNKKTAKKKVRQ